MEEILRRTVGDKIEVTCSYADEPHNVELDQGQFQQVVMNLVSNARDAMPDGGTLSVATENVAAGANKDRLPDADYVLLTVSDTGIGMNEHTRRRLFEPFFTTKVIGRGTGLGLSTVHGIVSDSDGHIFVQSEPEKGTTFRIYFPRTEKSLEASTDESAADSPLTGSETVLVVDDDEQILRYVETGLSSLGYRVLTASGGTAGLGVCKTEPGEIHVILSDVVMSGINGRKFLSNARRLRPDAVTIYISGYNPDILRWSRKAGEEIPFIQKPFGMAPLTRLMREQLDRIEDTDLSLSSPST